MKKDILLTPNYALARSFILKSKEIGPDPRAILAIGLTGLGIDILSASVGIKYGRFLHESLNAIYNGEENSNSLLVLLLSILCYRATAGLWSIFFLRELQRIDSEFKG